MRGSLEVHVCGRVKRTFIFLLGWHFLKYFPCDLLRSLCPVHLHPIAFAILKRFCFVIETVLEKKCSFGCEEDVLVHFLTLLIYILMLIHH